MVLYIVNHVNNFATKIHIFWYLSMVENSVLLSGSISMDGIHFCKQNKEFCMEIRMDEKLSQS